MDATFDVVDLVLWFLGALSVAVWAIVLHKAFMFFKASRQNRAFAQVFSATKHIRSLVTSGKSVQGSLARLCQAGIDELQSIVAGKISPNHQQELIVHALRAQAHMERTRLEMGLGVLASIGSTAPFIGLFGTVWGIMHALKDISSTGSAGLDVVAGPIGEALIATAIGIATAVPAVLAYNYFLRKVKLSAAEMDNFGSAFQALLIKSRTGEANYGDAL